MATKTAAAAKKNGAGAKKATAKRGRPAQEIGIPTASAERLAKAIQQSELAQRELARMQVDFRELLEVPDDYQLAWKRGRVKGSRELAFLHPKHPEISGKAARE